MKVTIDNLKSFSYCSKFYEQGGSFPKSIMEKYVTNFVSKIVEYVFRMDMENKTKMSWPRVLKRWNSFLDRWDFVATKTRNQSLVLLKSFYDWYVNVDLDVLAIHYLMSSVVYDHQLSSQVPVVFQNDDGVNLLFIEEAKEGYGLTFLDPIIRYTSVVLNETLPVKKIIVLAVDSHSGLNVLEKTPSNRFFESALLDFVSLVESMSNKITYPNIMSCDTCPLYMTCEVVND